MPDKHGWKRLKKYTYPLENSLTFGCSRVPLSISVWNPRRFSLPPFASTSTGRLNRLNEYTVKPTRLRRAPRRFPTVNFNRENMLHALFVRGSDARARARAQDNPPKRTNSFRSASSERRETTRHNARLWLEVGILFPFSPPPHLFHPSLSVTVAPRASADSRIAFARFLFIPPHDFRNSQLGILYADCIGNCSTVAAVAGEFFEETRFQFRRK